MTLIAAAVMWAGLACHLPGAVTRRIAPPTGAPEISLITPTVSESAVQATPTIAPTTGGELYPGEPPADLTEPAPSTEQSPAASTTAEPGETAAPTSPEQPAASPPPPEPEPQTTAAPPPSPTAFIPPATPEIAPTVTRTLAPAPPWVRAPLKASDPATVKLASGKVQLVQFFAFWSGPSQAMAPLIQGIEANYSDRVNFVHLDIDDPDTEPFQRQLRFEVEPHFFLLDENGRVLRQWTGYVTAVELQAAIESALER